jgi:hypothetical protein
MQCSSCHKRVTTGPADRLPPWCPHCGSDLKKKPATPPPLPPDASDTAAAWENTPVAVGVGDMPEWDRPSAPGATRSSTSSTHPSEPLSWREPAASTTSGEAALAAAYAGDDSLHGTIRRVKHAQREQTERRRSNRWTGLGMIVLGAFIIVAILGLNAFLAQNPDGGKIVVPIKGTIAGFLLIAVGGYTMLSGHDVLIVNATELYVIDVNSSGISRTLAHTAPSALEQGWAIPWPAIAALNYVEDPILGADSRMLEVHCRTGTVERVRIAPEITREELAAAAQTWGPGLSP